MSRTAKRRQTGSSASDSLVVNEVLIAVRQAADLLCDRWTLLILSSLFTGNQRYSAIRDQIGITNRTLTSRLNTLIANDIVIKSGYSANSQRKHYELTSAGKGFFKVFLSMHAWESRWLRPGARPLIEVTHSTCKTISLRPTPLCGACRAHIKSSREARFEATNNRLRTKPEKESVYRRSSPNATPKISVAQPLADICKIFGDKWTVEILVCAFLRVISFGDFQKSTGIATNILSNRLETLVKLDIFRATHLELNGNPVNAYRLTQRGQDLYPILVLLEEWADSWLKGRKRSPLRLMHLPCGNDLSILLVCESCEDQLEFDNCSVSLCQ